MAKEKKSPEKDPETTDQVVWDKKSLEKFLQGKITLGELQGFSKQTQYKLAEMGYNMVGGGKLDDAEKIFRGLVALDPKDPYFLLATGSIAQRKGDLTDAERWYTEALKHSPDHAVALANRGEVRLELGKLQEGAEDLIEGLKNDPKLIQPTSQRARALLVGLKATLDEAAQNASAAVKVAPAKKSAAKAGKKNPPKSKKN